MDKKLFGTDGLRGQVGDFPMTPEIALRLGLAVGEHFRSDRKEAKHQRAVIGKDTRLSGYVFEYALASGFCASGMDVFLVGVMPTPAVAFLTQSMKADVGVVISASHNPYKDNGIKLFDSQGFKLPDEVENKLSAKILDSETAWEFPYLQNVGRAKKIDDSPGRYNVFLKNTIPTEMSLDGLKVVLDCANGAAFRAVPQIFEELGAKVYLIGVGPDGLNINRETGSLYPGVAAKAVLEHGADIGISLDGDADRVIIIDEKGSILDGDQLMALCANDMISREALNKKLLVTTVMSNMALEIFMTSKGGRLLRTQVGDRYVVEAMRRSGCVFGGEQSGHLIFLNHSTTGDGSLAALQIIKIMLENNRPLSELAGLLTPYPQVLKNIPVNQKRPFEEIPRVNQLLNQAEKELAGRGRILLRYSGTENLARIMVEAEDETLVNRLSDSLVGVLAEEIGATTH